MTRAVLSIAVIAGALLVAPGAFAQPPARPDAHHPGGGPGGGPPGPPDAMRGEGHGMMPMEMCRQMMAGMGGMGGRHGRGGMGGGEHPMGMMGMGRGMGMGMMGMGDLPADPKQAAQVMEMRGEIMKAVGEILIKHGQRMQSAPPR